MINFKCLHFVFSFVCLTVLSSPEEAFAQGVSPDILLMYSNQLESPVLFFVLLLSFIHLVVPLSHLLQILLMLHLI